MQDNDLHDFIKSTSISALKPDRSGNNDALLRPNNRNPAWVNQMSRSEFRTSSTFHGIYRAPQVAETAF